MNLQKALDFLSQLREFNHRDWFNANKDLYNDAKGEFEGFVNILIPAIKSFDPEIDVGSAKECTFRIFRDIRFSKNKSPYKINFGSFISKGGRKSPFAGYYVHLQPGESFVGGGIYMPESKYLRAIRTKIYENVEQYKQIMNNAQFKKYFSEIYGEKLKTAPRDFPKDFPEIELLKNKHYAVSYRVNDSFWTTEKVIDTLTEIFKAQLPFNQFLNEAIRNELAVP
jgi:uncharacterized protein (TIGR02453 family)